MLRDNLTHLGLDAYDTKEALRRMHAIPADEIIRALPMGTILRSRYLDHADVKEKTIAACEDILGPAFAEQIRIAYSLDDDQAELGMLKFISEIRFYAPVLAAGKRFGLPENIKVRQYHMDQTNPFEGGLRGLASHALDIAYLLRNIEPWLEGPGTELSKRFAEAVVDFAYGEDEADVLVLGPQNEVRLMTPEEYDTTHRNGRGKLLSDIGWKKCLALGERLQGVPRPEL
ncbi:hypothetical protein ACHAQH_006780 [Verticillium albo-atrum]